MSDNRDYSMSLPTYDWITLKFCRKRSLIYNRLLITWQLHPPSRHTHVPTLFV